MEKSNYTSASMSYTSSCHLIVHVCVCTVHHCPPGCHHDPRLRIHFLHPSLDQLHSVAKLQHPCLHIQIRHPKSPFSWILFFPASLKILVIKCSEAEPATSPHQICPLDSIIGPGKARPGILLVRYWRAG
eukprot:245216-Pelagomonas_calceolata.AAC.7